MAILKKDVKVVKELLGLPLKIPGYQRPYKWQEHHVEQLLEDVIHQRGKSCYRLGTVVLHQDTHSPEANEPLHYIVDGQQRLLTLTLLCHLLGGDKVCHPFLLGQKFDSDITVRNLQHNATVIDNRISQLSEVDRREVLDFLLFRCQVVRVVLDDLSEAFQFFDSQNARGKALEPYDLLKAFHLREMAGNSEKEKTQCVAIWESGVDPEDNSPSLHTIMHDVLFRIRRWAVGSSGRQFDRSNISVFKGVSLHNAPYRYAESLRALDYMIDQYNTDAIRQWDKQKIPYPFQVDQTIINGKRFFEYIQQYSRLYQHLFIDNKPELKDIQSTINNYPDRHRTGDRYVKNLFYCAVLYYYDKFGDVELEKAARICFVWSYRVRLTQKRVPIESIDNLARNKKSLFQSIKSALTPFDVLNYPVAPIAASQLSKPSTSSPGDLNAKFKELGYIYDDKQ